MSPGIALRLGRVSNLPTVWTNVLAGAAVAGVAPSPGTVIALMLAMSLLYVAGMYWNDAFDAGYDRIHRPSRPIPAGVVGAGTVTAAGAAMALAALAILFALGMAPGGTGAAGPLGGVLLASTILVYDLWHKGNPVGPVLMGLCRALVYLTVAATLAGRIGVGGAWVAVLALCYLIGLTYAAKQEDLKRPGRLWPLLFLAAPFAWGLRATWPFGMATVAFAALAAAVAYALSHMVGRGRPDIGRTVTVLIAGICLLDALFIAAAGQPVLAALACAGFPLTLWLQRSVPGT